MKRTQLVSNKTNELIIIVAVELVVCIQVLWLCASFIALEVHSG